ncbi:MAG: VCBS repeat-containing protein, partial [Planctomycetes bacterium]|nr:VCBS repeat-containing protein [Planctomycetota bacterium]
ARLAPSSHGAWLEDAVDEWAALSFVQGGRLTAGASGGRLPDWAGRSELQALQFVADDHGALALGRLGDVKLRTEFSVHPGVPGVKVSVLVTNRTAGAVQDVTYAREWLQAGRLARAQWSLGTLQRRQSASLVFWYLPPGIAPPGGGTQSASALDLPVTLWVAPEHPYGLDIGATNGVSWGDFDADGWPDLFACESANLWRNLQGQGWALAADLDAILPHATIRYGAAFCDWDKDGLPDLATEPRKVLTGDTCMHLLRNLDGSGAFENVSAAEFDVAPCLADGETIAWGDVDGDGWPDLFLPAYPPWVLGGTDNLLYRNQGPGQQPRFTELGAAAGTGSPPPDGVRPEGAQLCDVDGDGDLDLYSNGMLYQNRSMPGEPLFFPLPPVASGIGNSKDMDEGAAFLDYDLDGDMDLFVVYVEAALGARIWENRGDGTFFLTESSVIDAPFLGVGLGLSAEDWDADGDIDFTTRHVFRRNRLLETGTRKFTLGLTPIPASYTTSATPAWADWDRDGDLDMALGNYLFHGSFWTNTSWDAGADASERRDVRVLALDDGPPGGAQSAFGATVELVLAGEGDSPGGGPLRRRKFVSSAGGYLNQNEYALTFFLPPDPDEGPADHVFDVVVDFPGAPGATPGTSAGPLRHIDRHVNPALGAIALATLADRELRVFRSGRVVRDGQVFEPLANAPRDLQLTNGGLLLPGATVPNPPQPVPTPNRWVGVDLSTLAASHPVHLREFIVDGQLDTPATCGGSAFNVAAWDVTPGSPATLLQESLQVASSSPRNDRTGVPLDLVLQPGRRYRLVAKVTSFRVSPAAPQAPGPLLVNGSLNFRNDVPCNGAAVVGAPADSSRALVAVRWAEEPHTTWADLGGALAGATGAPTLVAGGELSVGQVVSVTVRGAAPDAPAWIVLGLSAVNAPFKGGTLVPDPQVAYGPLLTNAGGGLVLSSTMSTDLPPGTTIVMQAWFADASGPEGATASSAQMGTSP